MGGGWNGTGGYDGWMEEHEGPPPLNPARWEEEAESGRRTRIETADFSICSGFERSYPVLSAILDYLERVNAVCPFAPWVARVRGYYVRTWTWSLSELERRAVEVRDELISDFFTLSPRVTEADQRPDPTTIVYGFGHVEATRAEFGTLVSRLADEWKPYFHERGLMLTQVHPHHPDPRGDGRFRARVPLLVCHRMHKEDIVFMRAPERIAKHQKFFGEQP